MDDRHSDVLSGIIWFSVRMAFFICRLIRKDFSQTLEGVKDLILSGMPTVMNGPYAEMVFRSIINLMKASEGRKNKSAILKKSRTY